MVFESPESKDKALYRIIPDSLVLLVLFLLIRSSQTVLLDRTACPPHPFPVGFWS